MQENIHYFTIKMVKCSFLKMNPDHTTRFQTETHLTFNLILLSIYLGLVDGYRTNLSHGKFL